VGIRREGKVPVRGTVPLHVRYDSTGEEWGKNPHHGGGQERKRTERGEQKSSPTKVKAKCVVLKGT